MDDVEDLPADARRWTFPERHPAGDGPWTGEPDKVQWVDVATGFDCLAVRSPYSGAWCGYVGLPPGHVWHGVDYDRIGAYAHNGISYSDRCRPEDLEGRGICHVAAPGRPDDLWWIGFHCSGIDDYAPLKHMRAAEWMGQWRELGDDDQVYRDLPFVVGVTHILAAQAHIAGTQSEPRLADDDPSATSSIISSGT